MQHPTSQQAGQHDALGRAALRVKQQFSGEPNTHTAHLKAPSPAQRVPDDAEASLNRLQSAPASSAKTSHAQDVQLPSQPVLRTTYSIPQLQQQRPAGTLQQPAETLQQPTETLNASTGIVDTQAPAVSNAAGFCHRAETPMWLPAQLQQLRQRYRLAQLEHGAEDMQPCVLMSQRVAFVVLEQFEQRDRAGVVDVLNAGLHVGQYVCCSYCVTARCAQPSVCVAQFSGFGSPHTCPKLACYCCVHDFWDVSVRVYVMGTNTMQLHR